MKPRLIVVGPLPPPYHGPAVSTSLILASAVLRERFDVDHLDTSDHRLRGNMNRWEIGNLALGLRNAAQLFHLLRGRRGVVYLPISQGAPGFMRDSAFVHLARLARWRVAVHLRGSEFSALFGTAKLPLRTWIRLTMRSVDSAAVMGRSLRNQFAGLLPPERVAVVPNGTPDLHPNGAVRDPDAVLFLSNLRRRKGVLEAVDAALRVLEQRPATRFVFAGEWEDASFERLVISRARRGGEHIRFLPSVVGEEKRQLLLSSSVFLFPAVEPEGHPRAVLEALSAGLPVVATDRGAIADTVGDGEAGFVLADPVPEELAAKLMAILEDPELRERMASAALERYAERFTQEHADEAMASWLESVVEPFSPQREATSR